MLHTKYAAAVYRAEGQFLIIHTKC